MSENVVPERTASELHNAAVAELPRLNRRHRALIARRDRLNAELAACEAAIKSQLRNVVVRHEERGTMAISHMADGSLLYWLPKDGEPDERVDQLADAIDRKGPEYA